MKKEIHQQATSEQKTTTVGVCIVNYKTAQLVAECLTSLSQSIPSAFSVSVVVVDNDSQDGSVELLHQCVKDNDWAHWVSIIAAEKNGGFSYGNNVAIHHLMLGQISEKDSDQIVELCESYSQFFDYFWLLNPDTRPLTASLSELVAYCEAHASVGIAGSALQDEDGTQQVACFNFPSPLGELVNILSLGALSKRFPNKVVPMTLPETASSVDWVAGASMLIRASVLDKIGLMDEGYFLYFEEVDYCWTAKKAGFSTHYVPESQVIHHVGAATGISDTRKKAPRRPAYWFESRQRFFWKHYGLFGAVKADTLAMAAFLGRRLKRRIRRLPDLDPPHFLRDFFSHSALFRLKRRPDGVVQAAVIRNASKKKRALAADASERSAVRVPLSSRFSECWACILEDYAAHGRDWTKPGFRAVAVYRFGVWRSQIKQSWIRAPLSILYRYLFRRMRNRYGIELPYSASVGRRVVIEHQSGIVIHGNSVIGDDCIIRQGVTLGNRYLDRPYEAPILGKNVNVGAGAKLMGAVHLDDGAVVGANAVVLHDVLAQQTVVGIPAKPIGPSLNSEACVKPSVEPNALSSACQVTDINSTL